MAAYCVWAGWHPGVYDTWEACKQETDGFSGARFKRYDNRTLAEAMFAAGSPDAQPVLEKKTDKVWIRRQEEARMHVRYELPADLDRQMDLSIALDGGNDLSWVDWL